MQKKINKSYLNTEECAEFIGRTPCAIRNLVARNAIPYRKPGGRLIFIKKELIKWIETPPIEIEKNIPIPYRDATKYPFSDMEVGDSFFIPLAGRDPIRVRNNLSSAAKKFTKKNGFKFAIRYMKKQGGVRCWREK